MDSDAECGARADGCVCSALAGHEARGEPHRCCCGGTWRGDFDGDDYEVIELPPGPF